MPCGPFALGSVAAAQHEFTFTSSGVRRGPDEALAVIRSANKRAIGAMPAALLLLGTAAFTALPPAAADASDGRARVLEAHAHEFVYYPRSIIYYAPLQNRWYWRESGEWREGRELPVDFADALDGGVRVTLDTARPWERHEVVRRQYPGAR